MTCAFLVLASSLLLNWPARFGKRENSLFSGRNFYFQTFESLLEKFGLSKKNLWFIGPVGLALTPQPEGDLLEWVRSSQLRQEIQLR